MFGINIKDFEVLTNQIERFNDTGVGIATRSTINGMAFAARSEWMQNIEDEFIQRNKFTKNSIRVVRSKSKIVGRQFARVGSIAPYMDDQEFGGTKQSTGKHGVPIATGYSAGQEGQQPRTRLPRAPNKRGRIKLRQKRSQSNPGRVREAAANGDKYVYMKYDGGRRKGIFRILGGKKKPRVKLVWDLSRQSVIIPKTPTLGPAVAVAERAGPGLFIKAAEFQLERARRSTR